MLEEALAVRLAERNLAAVLQDDDVVAVKRAAQLANAINVHEKRAVRPGETTLLRFPELPDASVSFVAPPDLPLGGF